MDLTFYVWFAYLMESLGFPFVWMAAGSDGLDCLTLPG